MTLHADHEEIRRTAAGLMAVLDIEKVGEQLVRLYGEEAVAAALSPVAEAVRAGASAPRYDTPLSDQIALAATTTKAVRRRAAADRVPQGPTGLVAAAQPWAPQWRPPRGTTRTDWL